MMMDDKEYGEHMLLTLDDEHENEKLVNDSCHTVLTADTGASTLMDEEEEDNIMEEDQSEFMSDGANVSFQKSSVCTLAENHCKPAAVKSSNSTKDDDAAVANATKEDTKEDPNCFPLPRKFDILCGQSRICASHTGNKRFQVVLDIYASKYDSVTTKQDKMTLTKEIVASIQDSGGRFLKFHNQDGVWKAISDVTARDKVSHALRTKVASRKRQREQSAQQEKTTKVSPAATASTVSASSQTKNSTSNPKPRPTHRRRSNAPRKRRSSSNSISTSASDIATSSFDANNSASSSVMDELLRSQREFFAVLTKDDAKNKGDVHPLLREKC